MSERTRPLSPHLTIYKNPITSYLSMGNRMSLVFLSVSSLGLIAWLLAIAAGPKAYKQFIELFSFWPIILLLMAVSQAFFYHLCMESCHFIWDTGRGLGVKSGTQFAVGTALISVFFNACFWIVIGLL